MGKWRREIQWYPSVSSPSNFTLSLHPLQKTAQLGSYKGHGFNLSSIRYIPLCHLDLHSTLLCSTPCSKGCPVQTVPTGRDEWNTLAGDWGGEKREAWVSIFWPHPLPDCKGLAAAPPKATAPVKCPLHTATPSGFFKPTVPFRPRSGKAEQASLY